jgi:2-polyprenyl-6-methoxyphenol hydroxylase-like FAD-dependent oxidoreductase
VEACATGTPHAAVTARNHTTEKITARLVVGVDGRGSAVRRWAEFAVEKLHLPFQFAGVQLTGVASRQDMSTFIFNPELGMIAIMIPQSKHRWRCYLGYPTRSGLTFQGTDKLESFVRESARAVPLMEAAYAKVECIGPLAAFDVSESWVRHPYRDGVALLGDAAATSDPTDGQGMSTALRSVRVLRDALLRHSDWDQAGNEYAREHDRYFQIVHTVSGWFRTLFQDTTAEAQAARQKAMPKIAEDLMRVPDHLFSGPDLPLDETVRARLFADV